jgi:hypothetical protein
VNIKLNNNTYTTNVTDEIFLNIHVLKILVLMHYISATKLPLSQPCAFKASTLQSTKNATYHTTKPSTSPESENSTKKQLTTLRDTHNSKDSQPTEFMAKIKIPLLNAFFSKVFWKKPKKQ